MEWVPPVRDGYTYPNQAVSRKVGLEHTLSCATSKFSVTSHQMMFTVHPMLSSISLISGLYMYSNFIEFLRLKILRILMVLHVHVYIDDFFILF